MLLSLTQRNKFLYWFVLGLWSVAFSALLLLFACGKGLYPLGYRPSGSQSFCAGANSTVSVFSLGSGTASDPYLICTVDQLSEIRQDLTAHYQLMQNIEAFETSSWNGGEGFQPIAHDTDSGTALHQGDTFDGTFDGNGYSIWNLYISRTTERYIGLFGKVGPSGVIGNLGMSNHQLVGEGFVGAIAGESEGTIQNAYAHGFLDCNDTALGTAGGIVGQNDGTIEDSYTGGRIDRVSYMGGIAGVNSGTIRRTYSRMTLGSWVGVTNAGGITGTNTGTIENSFSVAVFWQLTATTGNVVGTNPSGSVNNSYFEIMTGNAPNCSGDGSAVCTGVAAASTFTDITADPLDTWNFGADGDWILPQMGGFPRLAWQRPNRTISFAPEFIHGRKISSSDKANYTLRGYCSEPGAEIELVVPFSASSTCQGGKWEFTGLDFSAYAEGSITVQVRQEDTAESGVASLQLMKENAFCDAYGGDNPAGFAGGTGIESDPYTLCTAAHVNNLRNYLAAGTYFELRNNVSVAGVLALPIGSIATPFLGEIDGRNFVIENLTLNLPASDEVGLFGGVQGVIKNLGVENAFIVGKRFVGMIAGVLWGANARIENSHATGEVDGRALDFADAGGVTGVTTVGATIYRAFAVVHVKAVEDNVGGITGFTNGLSSISESFAMGNIRSVNEDIGGILGYGLSYTIERCFVIADIWSRDGSSTAGLVGLSNGLTIQDSYFQGTLGSSVSRTPAMVLGEHGGGTTLERVYGVAEVGGDHLQAVGMDFDGYTYNTVFWNSPGITSTREDRADIPREDPNIFNETRDTLQNQSTFEARGWNFGTVWTMPAGGGYPILQWQSDLSSLLF